MDGRKRAILASFIGVFGIIGGCIMAAAFGEGTPANAEFTGSGKCRACHLKQYASWKKTKHSMVFEQLQGAERKDPECVKCHTTGFGKPGGFVSEEKSEALENVGCESCHGPGSLHIPAALNVLNTSVAWEKKIDKVPQNVCVACHNSHVNRKEMAEQSRAAKKGN